MGTRERRQSIDATSLLDAPMPGVSWDGMWPGVVVSTADPLRAARVKVRVPQVYGDSDSSDEFIPDADLPWARPALPAHDYHAGFEVGDGVWVSFWGGTASEPIWHGQFLGDGDAPDEFVSSYTPGPKTRIIRTSNGHLIEMRWVEGQEQIRLVTAGQAKVEIVDGVGTTPPGPRITVSIGDKQVELNMATGALTVVNASGPVQVVGQGIELTSTSTAPTVQIGGGTSSSVFTGNVTHVYNGAYNFTVVGVTTLILAAVVATIASLTLAAPLIVTGVIAFGAAGAKFKLANERLFLILQDMLFVQQTHIHGGVTAGAGSTTAANINTGAQIGSPPRAGPLTNVPGGNIVGDVTLMTSQNLSAN